MTTLNKVVASLQEEHARLQKEIGNVEKALSALGHAGSSKFKRVKRVLSAEARRRIAEAQRLRWAKVRKQAAKVVKA